MEHGKKKPTANVTPPTDKEIEIIAKHYPDVADKLRERAKTGRTATCKACGREMTVENAPIDEPELFDGLCYDCEHKRG